MDDQLDEQQKERLREFSDFSKNQVFVLNEFSQFLSEGNATLSFFAKLSNFGRRLLQCLLALSVIFAMTKFDQIWIWVFG